MYKGIELSASLMCFDWLNAGSQLKDVEHCGVDYLHLDIIDGRFAKDFTMGSSIIDVFRNATKMKSDYHLMVDEPSSLFETFKKTEGDIFTIHQEACRNLHRDLVNIKKQNQGINVGIAISPATSLESLEYVIEDVDVVLLMMVDPGFKGQELVPQTIRKISKLKNMIDKMGVKVKISVDGNVHKNTIPLMVAAGADILVLGSSGLFKSDMNISDAISLVHKAIDEGIEIRCSGGGVNYVSSRN